MNNLIINEKVAVLNNVTIIIWQNNEIIYYVVQYFTFPLIQLIFTSIS